MKKQIQWVMLFCSSFILAGCLDLDQKITLVKDQLTYKAELKIDAKIAAFADKKQGGFCSDFGSSQNEGIVVDVKESAGGGNIICAITAQGHVGGHAGRAKRFMVGQCTEGDRIERKNSR